MVIDAKKQVLGRMASFAAKKALNGEDIVIVNAEQAYVSGDPKTIHAENHHKSNLKNKSNFNKGPYHPKRPDNYVRKVIRGMLPWKRKRGRQAYKKIMVFCGLPEKELKARAIPMPQKEDQLQKKKLRRKLTVAQICQGLGGKW